MREILFRGKRLDNGEWIEGHLIQYEDGRARICERHTEIFCYEKDRSIIQTVAHEVEPSTVGQYTCRMDKHGKRVFEEDILQLYTVWDGRSEPYGCHVVVRWCENDQCYVLTLKDDTHHVDDFGNYGRPEYYEVIGNIHDNPELLDGGADNG